MSQDIVAVLWKEWRELFYQRSTRGGLMNWAIMVALVGILMPLQTGAAWFTTPFLVLIWSWPPVLAVIWLVADSFAGERERHTLETLLASRLPDRAILAAKIIIAVVYGWSIEVVALALAAVTINLSQPAAQFMFYNPLWLGLTLVLSLALIALVCILGALISLRSATVRSAYQKMTLPLLVLFLLPTLITVIVPKEQRASLLGVMSLDPNPAVIAGIVGILLLIDLGLAWLAVQRFQRSRLILD